MKTYKYKYEVATDRDSFIGEIEAEDMFDAGVIIASEDGIPDLDDTIKFVTIIKID